MVAVLEGRNLIRWQVVALGQPLVGMAPPAGDTGHARGINQRSWLTGRKDGVFAVTIGAHGSIPYTMSHSLPVNALLVGILDRDMTGATGGRHVPMVDLCLRVARSEDSVIRVAVGT